MTVELVYLREVRDWAILGNEVLVMVDFQLVGYHQLMEHKKESGLVILERMVLGPLPNELRRIARIHRERYDSTLAHDSVIDSIDAL